MCIYACFRRTQKFVHARAHGTVFPKCKKVGLFGSRLEGALPVHMPKVVLTTGSPIPSQKWPNRVLEALLGAPFPDLSTPLDILFFWSCWRTQDQNWCCKRKKLWKTKRQHVTARTVSHTPPNSDLEIQMLKSGHIS